MKDFNTNIGFVGVGNLGRHAIFGLKDSYSISASDPIQNEEIKKLGISYQTIEDLCKNSDVIFLTIKPNKAEEVLNKVKELKKIQKEKKLNFDIEIDGGINFDNSKTAIEAGVNILVSGTTIFKSNNGDIKKNIELLKSK